MLHEDCITGRVVDLSASVCQMQDRGEGNDVAFISDYKTLVSRQKNSMIRQVLLDQVEQNPQGKIGLAKSACEVLQTGATMNRVRSLQVETIPSRSENPDLHDAQITSLAAINTVGIRHYCPQFASR